MENQEQQPSPPKIRLWRHLPILIVLGLAVHLLVPQITTLEHSWSVVKSLTWWAVALAVAAQVLSYLGNGYMLHAILKSNQQKLSTGRGALISMASQSIGLVVGWAGRQRLITGSAVPTRMATVQRWPGRYRRC
jgi:uncharacterized membrane protein YbhN (UPF0104 family)